MIGFERMEGIEHVKVNGTACKLPALENGISVWCTGTFGINKVAVKCVGKVTHAVMLMDGKSGEQYGYFHPICDLSEVAIEAFNQTSPPSLWGYKRGGETSPNVSELIPDGK